MMIKDDVVKQLLTAQGKCCSICHRSFNGFLKLGWAIDTDPATHQNRGILCLDCHSFTMKSRTPAFMERYREYVGGANA